MSEAFAETCAVTIPLLALAGVLEMRSAREQYEKRRADGAITANAALAMICAISIWAFLLLFGSLAEFLSLIYLANTESERARGDDISSLILYATMAQMAFLVMVPAFRAFVGVNRLFDELSKDDEPENPDS